MATTEGLQQLEITALKSIYDQDFFEPPPLKAWKAATRSPEFTIKAVHPDPLHAPKHQRCRFPKIHPTLATPVFTVQKPIRGLGRDVEGALSKVIHVEAQKSSQRSFPIEVEFRGIRFSAVKMFHLHKEFLGVTYLADPLCDDVHATLPLEVHIIESNSDYYVSSQGKKRLAQLEAEIQRLLADVTCMSCHNNISTDIMYDATLAEAENESHVDLCTREGILFALYLRPARRKQVAFKIKSVLRGMEYEVSPQDFVIWLHQQIAEQRRIDSSTSRTVNYSSAVPTGFGGKDTAGSDVQLLLPVDTKKQRKQVKQILLDRAYERGAHLRLR